MHALLSREREFELTEIAPDAETALRIVSERSPDVVLMDQGLPGMSGADAVARVLAIRPDTAVVMFSGSLTEDDLVTAVESGIRGYVPKGARVADVVSAIRRAAAGGILLGSDELARLLRRGRGRVRQRGERHRQRVESQDQRRRPDVLAPGRLARTHPPARGAKRPHRRRHRLHELVEACAYQRREALAATGVVSGRCENGDTRLAVAIRRDVTAQE